MTRWMLGWILDGSWVDFWWILGPSWEVSWGQVGIKIRYIGIPRRCQKIIEDLETRVEMSNSGPGRFWPLRIFYSTIQYPPRGQTEPQDTPHRAVGGTVADI